MRKLVIVLLSLMLVFAPVKAQGTATPEPDVADPGSGLSISIPEGSPWWAGIALLILGTGGFLLRGYSVRLDRKQQAAFEAQKQEFQLKYEQLKFEATRDSADAGQIAALASSIRDMATSVNSAITTLAQERLQAGEERKAMRETMEEQSRGIEERNRLLQEVGGKIDTVDQKLDPALKKIFERLKAIENSVGDLATKERVNQVIEDLEKLQRSDRLATDETQAVETAAPSDSRAHPIDKDSAAERAAKE